MNRVIILTLLAVLFLSNSSNMLLVAQIPFHHDPSVLKDPTGYKLRYGDRVRISIRSEPDCDVEGTITNEGKIDVVHIGEILIVGKSINERLASKFHDEIITVEKIGGLECGKCHY